MANGVFMQWLDEQAQLRKCELVVRAAGLDGSQRQILLEDFDRAVAVIYYELNLKLAFWQTLPVFSLASVRRLRAGQGGGNSGN